MPTWHDELTARLERLHLRAEREAEIVEELSQHLDDRVRELVTAGAAMDEARSEALADLDAPGELARQLAIIERRSPYDLPPPGRPARGRWLGAVWQDIAYSARALRRTPAFTLTVIAALALTIGPATAILSVGNWLLWRPAPGLIDPDRLAVVWFGNWDDDGSVSPRRVSDLNLKDLLQASSTLSGIAGWQESQVSFAVEGVAPRLVGSAHATPNFFDLLGVRPAAGRPFTPEEDLPPFGSPVAVLSDSLARSVFGSPGAAVGRPIVVNSRPMNVVGVLPPGFVGVRPTSQVDIWYPSATYYHLHHFRESTMQERKPRQDGAFYTFIVRLAPSATFAALRAELDVLVPALAEHHPDENKAFTTARARVFPGLGPRELQRDQYRELMRSLLIAGGVLLLLGCANVANLLISRGVSRQHERAVRVALGASRGRLVQLLLTESCLLAVAGAALGITIAIWLKELIRTLLLPAAAGIELAIPLDARVLLATLAVSLGCGLAAGLAPAWIGALSGRTVGLGRSDLRTSARGTRVRTGLAVGQLALSLALVTNALLLVATLQNLADVDIGFDPKGVSVQYVNLGDHGYDPARAMVYNRGLLERLSSAPAVENASISSNHPFGSGYIVRLEDPSGGNAPLSVYTNLVSDGYFEVLRIPLSRGRTFSRAEAMTGTRADGAPVILDERLAKRLFGDAEPVGRAVRVAATRGGPAHDLVVVGVTRGSRWNGLTDDPDLVMYAPFSYGAASWAERPVLMIRSGRPLNEVASLLQTHATALDPSVPLGPARPLTASIERELSGRRVFAWVLCLLGIVGFVLAAVGLAGLLAQMVNERTREFGIRMAIGADRAHVYGLVLRQAGWIAILGGAGGLALAVFGSRLVEAQLFGVTRLDPWVYLASAGSLMAIVFAASAWPARSAAKVEPVVALRAE